MIEGKAGSMPAFSVGGFVVRFWCLQRWGGRSLYATNGMLNKDNNPEENSKRMVALGHKIYLLAGSHASAERAAIFYSMFASCMIHGGLNPYDLLKDVLDKLAYWKLAYINELLSQNLAKQKAGLARRDCSVAY
jgi:hypothetical protein